MNNRVIVTGGGAAGMMAAVFAAQAGAEVILLEKNEKLGKKIYITGKGRCNFTNACDTDEFFSNVRSNPRFLYSSVYSFDAASVQNWFEEKGMKTKVERGNRAFPLSDHASDVTKTLERELRRLKVDIRFNSEVDRLLFQTEERKTVAGVRLKSGEKIAGRAVIIATGGLSYPVTGSTGDGYRLAEEAGHRVTELTPSLVPLNIKEADIPQMQGLSLKNVNLLVRKGKKKIFDGFGELMFTHFGITGPLVLSASADIQKEIAKGSLEAEIDLKPALPDEKLDARILRDFEQNKNKAFSNAIGGIYPSKMIPVIMKRAGIAPETPVHDITKAERAALVRVTKHFTMTITGLRGFSEAVITHGGVSVKEVDPSTMQSRLVSGLYFAGEVLDLDAYTGGFNLQIAWSTGRAAGAAAGADPEDAVSS